MVDINLSPAQQHLQAAAARVAQQLRSNQEAQDLTHDIDHDVIKNLGQAGFLGINIESKWGGSAQGTVAYALVLREIAQVDASVAVTMAVTNMVGETICRFGNDGQKAQFVPPLTSGKFFAGAFALSEAAAGSDPSSMTTAARAHKNGFLINGQKLWITSGDKAGVFIVWARTSEKALSCFLVDAKSAGISLGRPEEKMGLRASHTVAVNFSEVFVPQERLLGELGQGFKIAMAALDGGRIGISAQALGMAAAAYAIAKKYVGARGAPSQSAMFALADMAVLQEAAWLLTLRAAWRKEQGLAYTEQAAMAKVYATEVANRIIRLAMDVVGEASITESVGLARLFRDCRVTQIYEGTSEIQRLVISRALKSRPAQEADA